VLPAVVNMSVGGPSSTILNNAVEAVVASGVPFAVSAGNFAVDACWYSPSSAPNAVTVGATDANDSRAWFSNYGTCLDLYAPGVNITSAEICSDDCTGTHNGTSMASPHVAGALALYLSANPSATARQARDAIVNAATPNVVTSSGSKSSKLLFVDWTQTCKGRCASAARR
jgi:subtilisin family serine protease